MASDTIQVSTLDQLDAAIGFVDAQTSGSYTIELTGDIAAGTSPDVGTQLTDPQGHAEAVNGRPVFATNQIYALNLAAGVDVAIEGNGHTLSGADTSRGLFVYSGAVAVDDLTITHAKATGGDAGAGGGGAGLGAALFVASGATVSLSDVTLSDNNAAGGNGDGGAPVGNTSTLLGGGGMGGDGGSSTSGGGGGIGLGADGGTGEGFGFPGIVLGAPSGGSSGTGVSGGANGGGGAGGSGSGAGGGIGGASANTFGPGGNGGFGGGGGGAALPGPAGDGGFGGGGGGDSLGGADGGNGGFGGGGGLGSLSGGTGGFGGGDGGLLGAGAATRGGGGLGAGGAVFVEAGGSLTISGTFTVDGNTVAGGTGAHGGSAFGSGVFFQGAVGGTTTLHFGDGDQSISDVIADYAGSGGTNPDGGADAADQGGSLALDKSGTGTLTLSGANTYGGGTTVEAGTLVVGDDQALGSGTVAMAAGTTLAFAATGDFTLANDFAISGDPVFAPAAGTTQVISGVVADGDTPGMVEMQGPGTLFLSGANTYSGGTVLSGGILEVDGPTAGVPGAIASSPIGTGTLTFDGGTLKLLGTVFNAAILNAAGGTIDADGHGAAYFGNIADGDGTPGTLTIVDSSGENGSVLLGGANTYSGATVVGDGVNAVTLHATPTGLSAHSAFTVNTGAVLDLNENDQTIGSLAGSGEVTVGITHHTLTAGGDDSSTAFSGVMADGTGALAFTKAGTGTMILSGANTYTGATTVADGTLQVDGSIAHSAVTVESGATLDGDGAVGDVTVASGGTLAPGNSPGTIATGNLSLEAGSTLAEEIAGATPGAFDQAEVTGTVSLGGALNISLAAGYAPPIGQSFTIIDNDGSDAVSGTFAGLAEGATVTAGGHAFSISYEGGDGNDVVLTTIDQAPVAVADIGTVGENETKSFDVLANDSDPDQGDTLSLVALGPVTVGNHDHSADGIDASRAVSIDNGQIKFDPGTLFDLLSGNHQIEGSTADVIVPYTIEDSHGAQASSTLTIEVEGENDAPVAAAVSGNAEEDSGNPVTLAASYIDPDLYDEHSFSVDTTGTRGSVVVNDDGTFSYDPDGQFEYLRAGQTATDTFTYTVTDASGASSTATATVTIIGENDAPVASAISGQVDEGKGHPVTLTAAYDDPDVGDTHSFTVDATGTHGTVVNNGDGTFSYDPNGQFDYLAFGQTATDTFQYTVTDGSGASSTETATVTIHGVHHAPTALDDVAGAVPPNAGGHDPGGLAHLLSDLADLLSGHGPGHPAPTFDLSNLLGWLANGILGSRGHTDAIATGNVLANDTDPDGQDGLHVSAVSFEGHAAAVAAGHDTSLDGAFGTLMLGAEGSFDYVADPASPPHGWGGLPEGAVRQDVFTYTASDSYGTTSTATLTVTVPDDGETYIGGTAGDDRLAGGNGRSVVDGGGGDDVLIGGNGAGALVGGSGDDVLTGGRGGDVFVFNPGFGHDTITDFGAGDTIQLDHGLFANFHALESHLSSDGHGGTIITADADDTITLQHVSMAHLHASDFLFV